MPYIYVVRLHGKCKILHFTNFPVSSHASGLGQDDNGYKSLQRKEIFYIPKVHNDTLSLGTAMVSRKGGWGGGKAFGAGS
jgi:hypothetical protein